MQVLDKKQTPFISDEGKVIPLQARCGPDGE